MRGIYRVGLILLGCIAGCSSFKKTLNHEFSVLESKHQHHSGFMLYDPALSKELYSRKSDKYFTPASNTKILTLYTASTLLGDSLVAFQYAKRGDSLIIRGTGDPSFLNPEVYNNSRAYDFLATASETLYLCDDNFQTTHFGPGWAWSDYNYAYSAERSAFPVYGNVFEIKQKSNGMLEMSPPFFKNQVWLRDSLKEENFLREIGSNRTDYFPAKNTTQTTWKIPFRTTALTISGVLRDTLNRDVYLSGCPQTTFQNFYSIPSDSVYKVMMQASDNFIAEQLLLMSAFAISDTLKPEIAIQHMLQNKLNDLPDKPRWVDGSGLSRYNLITPRAVVALWNKLYTEIPRERLFSWLAVGGKYGTLKNLYRKEPPYIYGKTGTLSNNHALSGFLITKSGRVLIFSFMNNNYPGTAAEVRQDMERILDYIYQRY